MAEPTPTAKVVLYTMRGHLELELWAKEMPKAARNFLTQCQAGFYNGSYFHRIASSFVQAGPETDETIYDGPFDLETNGRIRFSRRGIVACAGTPKGQTSQLVFTTRAAPELASQCTILGRLVGESIYVLSSIGDAEKNDETPLHPVRIDRVEITQPFFDDLPKAMGNAALQPEPVSKRPKRQIRVFDEEDEVPIVIRKRNPLLRSDPQSDPKSDPKSDAGSDAESDLKSNSKPEPSPALQKVLAFESELAEFLVQKNVCR